MQRYIKFLHLKALAAASSRNVMSSFSQGTMPERDRVRDPVERW